MEANLALASFLSAELRRRGASLAREPAPGFGEHLVARLGEEVSGGLLLVGHMDTVHARGTLARSPFAVEGERVRGPGTYDMKGGLATVLVALDLLREAGEPLGGVTLLVTCDEEVGSPTSRTLIERLAREARAAIVLEPCVPGGAAKVRRKGVSGYRVRVEGRPAHAGIEPDRGASAVHELARWTLEALGLEDREAGTRLNVGVVRGGTRSNVVAAEAVAELDVRFWTREEAERVDRGLRRLAAADDRCRIDLEGGVNRWPLERTAESQALYERARAIAEGLGFALGAGSTGGASDGNLTSGVGCPTLDGLGPDGGGAHAADEHILLADVPRRIALVAELLRGALEGGRG